MRLLCLQLCIRSHRGGLGYFELVDCLHVCMTGGEAEAAMVAVAAEKHGAVSPGKKYNNNNEELQELDKLCVGGAAEEGEAHASCCP